MQLLLRKLESHLELGEAERRAVLGIAAQSRRLGPREALSPSPRAGAQVIEEGFACRYRVLPDGRRQILSYLVPGDLSDLRSFILGRPDLVASTLSPVSLAAIPREALLDLVERYPRLARAFWATTLVEESISREWLVNIGQRTALERVAHLFAELHRRLEAVGKVEEARFELPVTQAELADTLGLSTVHVNRTLKELRRRELLMMTGRQVHLLDVGALETVAMFSPAYLHLDAHGSEG